MRGSGRVALLPSLPPRLNHSVLTGTLSADPEPARGPTGVRVTLLRVEFPVADPDRSLSLWRSASCFVEVPEGRSAQDMEELRGGSEVLAAGQLSDRWVIEGGHACRRGVIVANVVKSGTAVPPPVVIADKRPPAEGRGRVA